jgi:hypothetical protein
VSRIDLGQFDPRVSPVNYQGDVVLRGRGSLEATPPEQGALRMAVDKGAVSTPKMLQVAGASASGLLRHRKDCGIAANRH